MAKTPKRYRNKDATKAWTAQQVTKLARRWKAHQYGKRTQYVDRSLGLLGKMYRHGVGDDYRERSHYKTVGAYSEVPVLIEIENLPCSKSRKKRKIVGRPEVRFAAEKVTFLSLGSNDDGQVGVMVKWDADQTPANAWKFGTAAHQHTTFTSFEGATQDPQARKALLAFLASDYAELFNSYQKGAYFGMERSSSVADRDDVHKQGTVANVVTKGTYPRESPEFSAPLRTVTNTGSLLKSLMRLKPLSAGPIADLVRMLRILRPSREQKHSMARLLEEVRQKPLYTNYVFRPVKLEHLFRLRLSTKLRPDLRLGLNACLAYAINALSGCPLLVTVGDFFDCMKNAAFQYGLRRFLLSFFDNKGFKLDWKAGPIFPLIHALGRLRLMGLRRGYSWSQEQLVDASTDPAVFTRLVQKSSCSRLLLQIDYLPQELSRHKLGTHVVTVVRDGNDVEIWDADGHFRVRASHVAKAGDLEIYLDGGDHVHDTHYCEDLLLLLAPAMRVTMHELYLAEVPQAHSTWLLPVLEHCQAREGNSQLPDTTDVRTLLFDGRRLNRDERSRQNSLAPAANQSTAATSAGHQLIIDGQDLAQLEDEEALAADQTPEVLRARHAAAAVQAVSELFSRRVERQVDQVERQAQINTCEPAHPDHHNNRQSTVDNNRQSTVVSDRNLSDYLQALANEGSQGTDMEEDIEPQSCEGAVLAQSVEDIEPQSCAGAVLAQSVEAIEQQSSEDDIF